MIKKKELFELNKKFLAENILRYPALQQGFFNANHILFLGLGMEEYTADKTDYAEREKCYQEMIKGTRLGKFMSKIVGNAWSHISFTNIVKKPVADISEPSESIINEFMPYTKAQIELVNPNIVVCMGKTAGKQFDIEEFYQVKKIGMTFYTMIPEHSYLLRTGQLDSEVDKIRTFLNAFFRSKGITKVTGRKVWYRDVEFTKKWYPNHEDNSYCFVRCEKETGYKSFDGRNLEMVKRETCFNDAESYEKHLTKKDIFYYNHINEIQHSKCIRTMYFDIETDFGNQIIEVDKPVISLVFLDSMSNKYYALLFKNDERQEINLEKLKNDSHDVEVKVCMTEEEMLDKFFTIAKEFDVLVGWYSAGFDWPYLINRAKKLNIDPGKYFENLKVNIEGRDVRIFQDTLTPFDALEFYRTTVYYQKPPSYSLDAVSKFLFGESFHKIKHSGVDKMWREDLTALLEYNVHDVFLLKMICDKSNIIEAPLQLQQVCAQDFENIFFNSKTIENILHHRAWKNKVYFPTKRDHDKKLFQGAIVLNPVKGIYSNVAVTDFEGMYPNLIKSLNISPDTLIGEQKNVEETFDSVKADLLKRYPELKEKFELFKTKEEVLKQWILAKTDFGMFYFLPSNWRVGILVKLIIEFGTMRKEYKRKRDSFPADSVEYRVYDELQGRIPKTLSNSVYGISGYNRFVIFSNEVPSAITTAGREMLGWVQKQSIQKNYVPLAGDTDSCFIGLPKEMNFETFVDNAKNFCKELNVSLKEFIKQFTENQYVIENHSNHIEFEKGFLSLALMDVKKRYFGKIKFYKGKILDEPKMAITGVDVRMNSLPIFFKSYLMQSYEIFLDGDYHTKLKDLYKKMKTDIKTQPVENLIIKTKLSRDVDTYTTLPIHLRALRNAKTSIRRGDFVNMIYIQGDTEVLHYDENQKQKFTMDYQRYLDTFFIQKLQLIDEKISFETSLKEFGF